MENQTGVVLCDCGINFDSRVAYPEAGVIVFLDPCPNCGATVEDQVDINDDTAIL